MVVDQGRERAKGSDLLGRDRGRWNRDSTPCVTREATVAWPQDEAIITEHFRAVLEDAKQADPEARKNWEIDWAYVADAVSRTRFYLAEGIDGRFLGIIGCEASPAIFGPVLYINTFYVTPVVRSQGVADELVDRVEQYAKSLGLEYVTGSFIYRRAAERLAKSRGYKFIGVNVLKKIV